MTQVMKATGGKGVNLVVNNVGGSVFAECVKSPRPTKAASPPSATSTA